MRTEAIGWKCNGRCRICCGLLIIFQIILVRQHLVLLLVFLEKESRRTKAVCKLMSSSIFTKELQVAQIPKAVRWLRCKFITVLMKALAREEPNMNRVTNN